MPAYILRNPPVDLWDAFRAKVQRDGKGLRQVILELIRAYVAEQAQAT